MSENIFEKKKAMEQALNDCIDPETGEVDEEKFAEYVNLSEEYDEKINTCIRAYKFHKAMANGLKAEIKAQKARQELHEKKEESIKKMLGQLLDGKKFESPAGIVRFRRSTAVEIPDKDAFLSWAKEQGLNDLVIVKQPEYRPNKAEISKYLSTQDCPYATLIENHNVNIK